ncbi:MAG: phosphoadenosine phosphosulfate reductase family protein [Desulfamplus sp.]|nr:phosphoadenosine phosphosulfate reductase family protein [Desulfamplus sp.]
MSEHVNSRAFWCDSCHVPLLGNICHACGSAGREISTAALVPVFRQEINYLKKRLTAELHTFLNDSEIWVTPGNHTYYGYGEALFRLSSTSTEIYELKTLKQSTSYRRSRDKTFKILHKANRPYVEQMQYEAEQFIRDTIREYKGLPVLVSFSGGKDSTVASHLVMNALGRSDVLHVFADTTIEFPDTYKYINEFQQEHPLTPFISSRSQLDFFETAQSIGPPSRILRWCCTTHKTNPLAKIINSLSPNQGVLTFDGVRRSESARRSKYQRITKQHKIVNEILASPIIEWSDLAVWIYMLFHGLNFNKAYKKGFRRVGCLYCPFNSDWSYEITKERYPQKYQRWQTFLMEQALRMAHPNPENFVDKGWRARAGGRGLDYYKASIESAPCLLSDSALSYQLLSGDIRSVRYFLRPLGLQTWIRSTNYSETFLIHDHVTNIMLASVEVSFQDKTVRINYLIEKGKLVFKQRIEKQLKKLQSCINCGACGAKCLLKALVITNQKFFIDENNCVSCLACVKHRCPAVDSLKKKGK